jgi:predicted nucleic acid-binding protein
VSVAIDAMVLIWGLKSAQHKGKKPSAHDVEMRRRTRILFEELAEDKETVVVSAVVAAEVMAGIDPADHPNFVAELQGRFFLPPFNLQAASVAATLWRATRVLPKDEQPDRKTLKADVMIVAAAKVAGATKLFSHDGNLKKLAARAGITASDLPMTARNLFVESESRKAAGEDN